jgi:hypothetical protein
MIKGFCPIPCLERQGGSGIIQGGREDPDVQSSNFLKESITAGSTFRNGILAFR